MFETRNSIIFKLKEIHFCKFDSGFFCFETKHIQACCKICYYKWCYLTYPVSTRRCFDINVTLFGRQQRWNNVGCKKHVLNLLTVKSFQLSEIMYKPTKETNYPSSIFNLHEINPRTSFSIDRIQPSFESQSQSIYGTISAIDRLVRYFDFVWN